MANIQVYGLLHLAQNEFSAVNIKVKGFMDQINVYLSNAVLLNNSLKKQNLDFTLLTNNKELLLSNSNNLLDQINVEEIKISTIVPSGTKFYSAHFKVDAFRHIGKTDVDYAIFCDLDVVCLQPLPEVFGTLIAEKTPLVFDITDQLIPAYGHISMINMFQKITSIPSEGRWLGGEFIAGPTDFFALLAAEIDDLLPRYFELLKADQIPSKGNDEVYTSSAIELMKHNGVMLSDAGPIKVVGRYWSSGTGFVQNKFKYFEDCFLLHLPANKDFLTNFAKNIEEFNSDKFLHEYKKFLLKKRIKSTHRYLIYFLFAIKERTIFLRSIKFKTKDL